MFDVGFSEILVIALVALIVIGPERLPKVARMLGHLFGRLQRYVAEVKADIDREMQMDELKKLQSNMQEAAREIEQSVNREVRAAESQVSAVTDDLEKAADSPPQAGAAAPPPKQP